MVLADHTVSCQIGKEQFDLELRGSCPVTHSAKGKRGTSPALGKRGTRPQKATVCKTESTSTTSDATSDNMEKNQTN